MNLVFVIFHEILINNGSLAENPQRKTSGEVTE